MFGFQLLVVIRILPSLFTFLDRAVRSVILWIGCPSGFQTTVEKKFKVTGGAYIEVSNNYRASQYDHTADDYIKKKLSDRLYRLRDGTLVQRDWYSSFLLYCYDYRTQDIDKDKCITDFGRCYDKEKALIAWIKANHIKILNSGIKVA